MSRPLDIGLDQIKTLLLKMGKLSEGSLALAVKSYTGKENHYVQIKAWSNTLLILSEEVEDRAMEMIALHQPMAKDLRTLKAYIKIAYDMERYGRYALDISDITRRLEGWEPFPEDGLKVAEMGEKVKEIVRLSVTLTETQNESLVWELSKMEAEIDDLYLENLKVLAGSRESSAKTIIVNLLTIRYLERIADHASYIAEAITYAITGKRLELR
jgi:phosphate transport system protein